MIEKARAGILPIFKRQSGFIAYGVIPVGDKLRTGCRRTST